MFLYQLDILSSPITIYYNKREKHSSFISVFLSFIIYFTGLFLTIYFFIDFLKRKYPSTFFYKTILEDTGKIYLNKSDFFHFLNIYSNNSYDNTDNYIVVGFISNNSEYNAFGEKEMDYWIYDKCDESDLEYFIGKINYTEFNRGLCLKKFYNSNEKEFYNINESKFEYPYDLHGIDSKEHEFYVIGAYGCNFNISNYIPDNCSITEENENILRGDEISLFITSAFADLQNYTYPIKEKIISYFSTIPSILGTLKTLSFHSLKVDSDNGIFLHNIHYYYSLVLDSLSSKSNVYTKPSTLFIIQIGNEVDFYERFYSKIQDIFAKLGGMIGIILVVVKESHEILYYKFRLLYDFNDLIFKEIGNKKKNEEINSSINNSKTPITLQRSNYISFNTKKFNLNQNYNSNNIIKNSICDINNIDKKENKKLFSNLKKNKYTDDFNKMEKNYKKVSYSKYVLNFFICDSKNENYLNQIFIYRTNILSESTFLSNFLNIEFLKAEVKNFYNNLNYKNENKHNKKVEFYEENDNNLLSNLIKNNHSNFPSSSNFQIESNKTYESKINLAINDNIK